MQLEVLQSEMTIQERTERVREAYQKAEPTTKSKILELAPFQIKAEHSASMNGFCQWAQSWPQWQQSHW